MAIYFNNNISQSELEQLKELIRNNSGNLVVLKDDTPNKELRADFIYDKLAEWLDAPCNWSFKDIGYVDDYMYEQFGDWCDRNCRNDNGAACWKKLLEGVADEQHG